MRNCFLVVFFSFLISALPAAAQDAGPPLYKVEFVIHDSASASGKDGKYTLLMEANSKSSYSSNAKVPYQTSPGNSTQFTYMDVAVRISANVQNEDGGKLGLIAEIDLVTVLPSDKGSGSQPIMSTTRITQHSSMTPGKSMKLASVEETYPARKIDMDVTLTKVN